MEVGRDPYLESSADEDHEVGTLSTRKIVQRLALQQLD